MEATLARRTGPARPGLGPRPRSSGPRPSIGVVGIGLACLGLLLACERPVEPAADSARPPGPESAHTLRYPLVAFRGDRPGRWQRAGELGRIVVELPGGARRALVSRGDGLLRFELERFAGGELHSEIALLPNPRTRRRESAEFELRSLTRPGAEGGAKAADSPPSVLFSRTLETGDTQTVSIALPADATHLELIVRHAARDGRRSATAVWFEPTLLATIARPRARDAAASLLLITVDTTRADELGSYGGPVATPTLDALAADGVLFTNAHSVAFGTTPSHASLFTSLPASRHRVLDNASLLSGNQQTLAEVLRAHGYHTGAFVSAVPLSRSLALGQGFDVYDDAFLPDPVSGLGGTSRFQRRADTTLDELIAWLDTLPHGEAFFGWAHLFDAHRPYGPPPGYAERFASSAASAGATEPRAPAPQRTRAGPRPVDGTRDEARARYRGEIAFIDEQIGRVLSALRESGRYDDTLIVFVADHGENFFERSPHLAHGHGGLHAEVTQLPLVLKPQVGSALHAVGTRSEELVANTDVAPTVLALLGIEAPASWIGKSLLPWLRDDEGGPDRSPHDHLVLESSRRREVAVRTDRWLYRALEGKAEPRTLAALGYQAGVPVELFDLAADPGAHLNVADEHPALIAELGALAAGSAARTAPTPEARVLDPEHVEALEALGYLVE